MSKLHKYYTPFSARLNDVLCFDVATLAWSDGSPPASAPRPAPRESMGFAWANGTIYLYGGLTDAGSRDTHAIARTREQRDRLKGLHLACNSLPTRPVPVLPHPPSLEARRTQSSDTHALVGKPT